MYSKCSLEKTGEMTFSTEFLYVGTKIVHSINASYSYCTYRSNLQKYVQEISMVLILDGVYIFRKLLKVPIIGRWKPGRTIY